MACPIPYTITVERRLDGSWGVPSYSTHSGGFSLLCKWQSNGGGWGAINPTRIVQAFAYSYSSVCPAGSIGQIAESSEEYIYVRGGSVYNIRVDGTSYTDVNLRTATHTPHPDWPNISRPGVVDSIVVPVVDLDTKASKDELLSTGIDISSRKIVLTSDKVVFQNNSGGQIALFENNKIKADLIDARSIVTGALIAEQIAATNIETGKLTVTNGASVGDFRISGGSLSAEHTPAVIGFIYGNNSASLGAGTLMIDKSNTGNAILVRGGAGFVSMDVNSFEVTSKNGLVVSPHYSNPNGTALAINGKIKTGGKNGQTKSFAISSGWIDGGGAVIDLEVVNGLIVGITWRR